MKTIHEIRLPGSARVYCLLSSNLVQDLVDRYKISPQDADELEVYETLNEVVRAYETDIKNSAISKLTYAERRVLGLNPS